MSKTTLIDCCIKKYAYREISEIYKEIGASPQGLFPEQVDGMRRRYGENSFAKRKKDTMLRCLRRAFINPFHIILFVLGMISLATDVVLASNFARNATTAIIIFSMILTSGVIRLIQELRAKNAAQQLGVGLPTLRDTVSGRAAGNIGGRIGGRGYCSAFGGRPRACGYPFDEGQ